VRVITAADLAASLDYASLIERLREGFRAGCTVPVRHHHTIASRGDSADATLLLMPAWREDGAMGVKVASVFPGNAERGLPAVMASYLLIDGATGEPRALLDGGELTARRTASASALASGYLSRPDSRHLLMVGTGVLAPHLIRAHATARPINQVMVWGRTAEKARALAVKLNGPGLAVTAIDDLENGVRQADIISCATLARDPLIHGAWLHDGQHVDLVGGFTPAMREADDATVCRASLFVDTRAGALKEAGDLVDPLGRGVIAEDAVRGDLFDLARGDHRGRESDREITVFKSVGTALEDLAAAELAFERV
jgi:ornithine cyclodeaminase